MLNKANTTGILLSKSSFLKCSSILFAPFRSASKFSKPTTKAIEIPAALQRENRPPIQSHMGKTFAGKIPNSDIFAALVDTAAKCLATSFSVADFKNHSLIVIALLSVS